MTYTATARSSKAAYKTAFISKSTVKSKLALEAINALANIISITGIHYKQINGTTALVLRSNKQLFDVNVSLM